MNRIKTTYFTAFILLLALQLSAQVKLVTSSKSENKIWDNRPAKTWMEDAYPIGNGRIGGMIFGGIKKEHIQFNDNTLWTGN
jgi:alpha-L-fucosidase 2